MVVIGIAHQGLDGLIGHDHEPVPRDVHHERRGERTVEGRDAFAWEGVLEDLSVGQ